MVMYGFKHTNELTKFFSIAEIMYTFSYLFAFAMCAYEHFPYGFVWHLV